MLTKSDILSVSDSYIHLEEFVDRTFETSQFQTLVNKRYEERDERKRIIAFYGPAGIGKTVLLDRLEFECLRKKIPFCRINFEVGLYNNAIKILREMVDELDPNREIFGSWTRLYQEWFSCETNVANVNIKVEGQGANLDFQGASASFSGDVFTGHKVEVGRVEVNLNTRVAHDPEGAQTALTESFIQILRDFVQQKPAVIMFEGMDHKLCPPEIREWVNNLLDKTRVLKGFGALPIVTYFEIPNPEAKLRAVTLRAELKPLAQEHIIEYFRARRVPESIIENAAKVCIEETNGIPLRVLEYTENHFPYIDDEEPNETSVPIVVQVEEKLQEAEELIATSQIGVVEAVDIPETSVLTVPVQEAPLEDTSLIEPVQETQSEIQPEVVELIVSEETTTPIEIEGESVFETPAEAVLEEAGKTDQTPAASMESLSDQQAGEKHEFAETSLPEVDAQKDEIIAEPIPGLSEGEEIASEMTSPTEEAKLVGIEKNEEDAEVVQAQAEAKPAPQPMEEVTDSTSVPPQEESTAAQPEKGLETAPVAAKETSPTAPTPEEIDKQAKEFHRRQERLEQQKAQGKSSTASMVDGLLGRQKAEVADMARRCAALRWFTVDLIRIVADQPLSQEQAAEIFNTITHWRFVQKIDNGTYGYRREVQKYLRSEMQHDDPELYLEIHRRAQAYFEKQMGFVDLNNEMLWVNMQPEQVNALRENLYYLLQLDVKRGFTLLGQLFQGTRRLNLFGESAILLKFAEDVDKSDLDEYYLNRLAYYDAVLEAAEKATESAEAKLRALMGKRLDDELIAQVQGELGAVSVESKKYDEAIKFFEQAQKIWQKLKRERERSKLSNNLGLVYMRKSDLGRAERSFNDALNGLKKAGTPSERAFTLNNLGNVYKQREKYNQALEYYQNSLTIKTSIGDSYGAANTNTNIGTVYQQMAKDASGKKQTEYRQSAIEFYLRSLKTYQAFGSRSNQAKLFYKLALLYFQAGDKTNAKVFLAGALEIFRELEMPDLESAGKLEKLLA
jgi:tetratricopeptide (TPR) repeat protein